jgi:gluconolactonase
MAALRGWTVLLAALAAVFPTTRVLFARGSMTTQNTAFPKPPGIERLDPALDQLIAPDAAIEVLAGGYDWTEGPVWVKDGGYLLFSDIPPNKIHRWKQGEGAKLYLTPSGYTSKEPRGGEVGSNGLTLDREGRLVLAQHGDRRIARMDAPLSSPQARFTTLADR